jgi:hypothetical protein
VDMRLEVSGSGASSRPELRAASGTGGVNLEAAERAAADFLAALGIDRSREGLRETPARMARAYAELFDVRPLQLTTFPNDEGYDELVLVRAIPFGTALAGTLRTDARSPAEFFALAGISPPRPGPGA